MTLRYNPFRDYDKYGCIKLPWTLYLSMAFLLKSYVIWIVSLSFRQDTTALLNLFYPNKHMFSMGLLVSTPALFIAVLVCCRRVGMPCFIQALWSKIRWWLAGSALVQLLYILNMGTLSLHTLSHWQSNYTKLLEFLLLLLIIVYSKYNQRLKDVSAEFPQAPQEN